MKAPLNQIFIVVGFFSLSIGTLLAVCWGVTHVFVTEASAEIVPKEIIAPLSSTTESASDVHLSIKLLIPKLK